MSPGCLSVSKVAGTALRSGSCWKRTFRPFVKHWRSISIITVEILIFWLFLALPTLLTPQAHQFPQQDSPARPPPQSPQSPAPRAPLATRPTRTQRTHINAHPKIASRACSLPTQPRRTHHTPTRAPPQGAAAGPAEGGVPRVSSAHLLGALRFGRRLALLLGRRRRRGRGRGTRSFRGIGRRRARRRCSTLLATAAHEQRMVSKWWVEDRGYSGAGAKVAPAGEESAGGSKGVGGAVRLTLGRIDRPVAMRWGRSGG